MRERLKRFMYPIISGAVLAAAFAAVTVYANWTPPLATPPTCATGNPGCDVPLHTGAQDQIKTGGLSVGQGLTAASLGFGVINGRVGIGTISPVAILDVRGTISTGAAAGVDTNIRVGGSGTGNRNAYIDFRGDDTYSSYGLRILRGNAGPNAYSQIAHRGTGDLFLQAVEAAAIKFKTANTDRMTIAPGGAVGIGTITPSTSHSAPATVALDVAGKRITGVQDPVDDDDAVSLGYLKAQSGGGGQYIVTTQSKVLNGGAILPPCGSEFPAPFCPSGWTVQTSWTYEDDYASNNVDATVSNTKSCKRETLCMKQ